MPVCSVGGLVVSGVALVLKDTRATPLTTGAPTEHTGIT